MFICTYDNYKTLTREKGFIMSKTIKTLLISATLLSATIPALSNVQSVEASESVNIEQINDDVEVIKNEKYLQFEQELAKIQKSEGLKETDKNARINTLKTPENSNISAEQFFELVEKFDGAEATVVTAQAAASYTTRFINGGVNSFTHSEPGLNVLYNDLGNSAAALRAGRAVGGFLGKVMGGFSGIFIPRSLARHVSSAADGVYEFIAKGYDAGGARFTLTDGFPIGYLTSVKPYHP